MCAPCHVLTLSRHSSDTGDRVTVTGTRYADAERPKSEVGRNAIGIYMREVWRSPETSVRPLRVGRSDTARLPHTPHTCHPRDPDGSKRAEQRHEDERAGSRLANADPRIRPIIRSNFPAKLPVYKLSSTPRGRAHSTQVTFDTRILVLMSCGPASSRVSRPCRASGPVVGSPSVPPRARTARAR